MTELPRISRDDERFIGYLIGCEWGEVCQRAQARWGVRIAEVSIGAEEWARLSQAGRRFALTAVAATANDDE